METDLGLAVEAVRGYLARLATVPANELQEFVEQMSLLNLRPKETFTRPGEPNPRLGFVISGLLRVFYTGADDTAHVRNFCFEGTPIGAYAAALTGAEANVTIEALEPSRVLAFPYSALQTQFARGAAWERLGRRIAEEHYISRERREHALLTLDARARLERFHQDFPGLASRLRVADIASYIAVRPETLSRLRRPMRAKTPSGPR